MDEEDFVEALVTVGFDVVSEDYVISVAEGINVEDAIDILQEAIEVLKQLL